MKRIYLFGVISLSTLLFSCGQRNKFDNEILLAIPVEAFLKLSDFSLPLDFIVLEQDSSSFFGNIENLTMADSLIFFTTNKSLELFCYSLSGKFLFKISSVGKGPFEYTGITGFTINHKKKQIIIYDLSTRKFIVFAMNGIPLREYNTKWFFREIASTEYGLVGYEASNFNLDGDLSYAPGIILIDSLYNYSRHLFKVNKPAYPHIKKSLYSIDGNVFFNPYWERCIYKLTQKGLRKNLQYTFGPLNVSNVSGLFDGKLNLAEMNNSNTAYFLYNYYKASNFELLNHAIGPTSYYFLLNNGRLIKSGHILLNDLTGPVMLSPLYAGKDFILFNDPNNVLPFYDEWVNIYKMYHHNEPDLKLKSLYKSIEKYSGNVSNNIIVRLKMN
ncbi:MAG: 6-bladed beta-propeller [Bacteroidia bacterium]|nr:6-bladed beta-propeller [Bacteroidia bacterium]